MSEKCNHDVYERLAVADTMCIICLQDHIHSLEEKVRELEKEKFYWNCPIHGKSQNAWGCPECVRELRQEKKQAETRTKKLEDAINNTGCLLLKNSIGKSKEIEDE